MKAWQDFIKCIEKEIGCESTNKWLYSLNIIKYDARNLYLEVKDAFHVNWFEEHIRNKAKTKLFNNNNQLIKVHLVLPGTKEKPLKKNFFSKDNFEIKKDTLDPNYTFENFENSSNDNKMVFKFLTNLIDKKETFENYSINPIFIYGKKNSGKTHLLMASANTLNQKGYRVLYCNAKNFTSNVVYAIKTSNMEKFRQFYRNCDILIVDDIDIFAKKNATQEEFFHTFNTLHNMGCLIILSATLPPSQIDNIEPRLISRFEWGILLNILPPNKNQLFEIAKTWAKKLKLNFDPKIISYLTNTFDNASSISKALQAIALHSHLTNNEKINDIDLIENAIKNLKELNNKKEITAKEIIKIISSYFGIRTEDILSNPKVENVQPLDNLQCFFAEQN